MQLPSCDSPNTSQRFALGESNVRLVCENSTYSVSVLQGCEGQWYCSTTTAMHGINTPLPPSLPSCPTPPCNITRLITVFPQLRKLLDTMTTVAAMLLKIMVLYSCVSYSFAAVGMAIFGDAKSTILEPRCAAEVSKCHITPVFYHAYYRRT